MIRIVNNRSIIIIIQKFIYLVTIFNENKNKQKMSNLFLIK